MGAGTLSTIGESSTGSVESSGAAPLCHEPGQHPHPPGVGGPPRDAGHGHHLGGPGGGGTEMHVDSITMSTKVQGPRTRGRATVVIVDENGCAIARSTITKLAARIQRIDRAEEFKNLRFIAIADLCDSLLTPPPEKIFYNFKFLPRYVPGRYKEI